MELDEGPTAANIWDRLPFEASASRWGDEIYFQIAVSADLEDGVCETVEVGDVAYWPQGEALCLRPHAGQHRRGAQSRKPRHGGRQDLRGVENIGRIAPGENLKVEKVAE